MKPVVEQGQDIFVVRRDRKSSGGAVNTVSLLKGQGRIPVKVGIVILVQVNIIPQG